MWSKISNALKSHTTSNKGEQSLSVMSKVFEQHPNLSIFHANESGVLHSSPPPSPSVHSKPDMFKRLSKGPSKDDGHDVADSQLAIGNTDLMPSILACDPDANASAQITAGVNSAHNFGVSTSVSPLEISVLPSTTVFENMLRSSSSPPRRPEEDINDESATDIVVYSGGTSEPDPFNAHATTYYTAQTMIPTTPQKHGRKTSKEESLIISLQTQLALKTELCGHYETDLKARDELVEILGKKLADLEKDDTQRKNTLRSWKKKVQELERLCRQLEESAEDSMHERMERSVMDEASSEALRMLHCQIATLEREKNELKKEQLERDEASRDQIATLEREKNELKRVQFERTTLERELNREQLERDETSKNQIATLERENNDLKREQFERAALERELKKELLERDEVSKDQIATLEKENNELKREQFERATLERELKRELYERDESSRDQIATLEREKDELKRELLERGEVSRDQVATLEREKNELKREQIKRATLEREKNELKREQLERDEASRDRIATLEREKDELHREQLERDEASRDQIAALERENDVMKREQLDRDEASRDRIVGLKEEVEQLRRHVHSLQQESADKEVKIVQMMKQHSLDKEDLQGLNIALDSKQQELQLLKRKYGVKGTAGSTPAQPYKASHRRESSFFTATPLPSRPPSVISDSGTDTLDIPRRKASLEMSASSAKVLAFGKSTRVNGSGSSSIPSSANKTVVRAGKDGSIMGPPALKPRPSIGTPTPSAMGPSLSRRSSAKGLVTTPSNFHRRVSSMNSERQVKTKISRTTVNASPAPSSVLEEDEKENMLLDTPILA